MERPLHDIASEAADFLAKMNETVDDDEYMKLADEFIARLDTDFKDIFEVME